MTKEQFLHSVKLERTPSVRQTKSEPILSVSNSDRSTRAIKAKKYKCLIGCSGSVATLKLPELAVLLSHDYEILIVMTNHAKDFLNKAKEYNESIWNEFLEIDGLNLLFDDNDEWALWNRLGDPVLHIELTKWADLLLIAPGSADLISKASVGISDNLLLSVMRAWDLEAKPCLLCPAMNTFMWYHPSTQTSLELMKKWGWCVIYPVEKKLACYDVGIGALAPVKEIVKHVRYHLRLEGGLIGEGEEYESGDENNNNGRKMMNYQRLVKRSLISLGILGAVHLAVYSLNRMNATKK
jgi:phosphopantothenoylcysteine decarboxylase